MGSCFCPACLDHLRQAQPISLEAPYLDGIYAAGVFKGVWRSAIHAFKYEGQRGLAETLAGLLPVFPEVLPAAIVIPVPLHPTRRRWRGFNQATLLARALATRLGLHLTTGALTRVRDTRPQVGLSRAARWRNVRDAFRAERALVADQEVVLVDDVFTTGATLSACASALRQAGAARVWAVALACPPRPGMTA